MARRLMLALMLVTLVPLAVLAGFIERTVSSALVDIAAKDVQAQARILAASIPPGFEASLTMPLLEGARGMGTAPAVIDRDWRYLAHPDRSRVGQSAREEFMASSLRGIFEQSEGVVREPESGRLIGYAELPGRSAVAVVASDRSVVQEPLSLIRLVTLAQIGVGLLFVLVIGSLVIARVTRPVQRLTRAAERIGAGELDIELDRAGMDGELRVLADTFEQMSERLRLSYAALERQVAERSAALSTINTVADLVSRSPDLERVLEDGIDGLLEALEVESGVIFLRDGVSGELEIAARRDHDGADQPLPPAASRSPMARRAVESMQAVVINDASRTTLATEPLLGGAMQSLAAVPLIAQGRAVGALAVACREPERFPPETVDLLVTIGNQIGVAVESARLYEQAGQLAALEERQRLARDLHDAVSQSLYGVSLHAEAASRMMKDDRTAEAAENLDRLRQSAADAIAEMRLLIFELRPPILQQSGLDGALQTRLETVERRAGLETALRVEGYERQPAEVEEALYRIAQEALNNALKHARASRVEIHLVQNDALTLEVLDDGVGFDPSKVHGGGIGLSSMRERAERMGASFDVGAGLNGGSRVRVTLQV